MATPGKLSKYMGVDGEGRQTSIELPEWALEATQAKCFAKLEKVAKSLAKGGDNYNLLKDVKLAIDGNADAIKKLADNSKKTGKTSTTTNNKSNQNDTGKAADALADAAKGQNNALMKLKKLADKNKTSDGGNILTGLAGKAGPFAIMGNMIGKVVGVLAKFVGAIVAATVAVATFIGTQLMKVFNLMNDSLSDGTAGIIGALTTGSTNIATQASKAGLGLKDFTEAIQESSEEIAVLGAEGYTDLRNATRDMAGGLFDMGYKNAEITKLLGREISIRARLGMRLDAEGTNLATDVVRIGKELRRVGAAAGISAEELYARSKLEDETNTLIAARARELGDNGISALQTSIRTLSMQMVAISPTYASAITTPLVNAMITGAVGLDDNFTDLVSVFPGLVKSFDMAKRDINDSGELSADTIEGIMTSLVDTTEDEFKRAKQLALMTRNQTAIQAVNFASEARARQALIGDITKSSQSRERNISTISAQADTFFDMMKAPFENAFMQFTLGVLGVSTQKDGVNFGTVITKAGTMIADWVYSLPVIGQILQESQFIERFNSYVAAYFKEDATAAERKIASEKIYGFVGDTIDKVSAHIGDELKKTSLASIITDFFKQFMGETAIMVYESTGLLSNNAIAAYSAKGDKENLQKALNVDGYGFEYGTDAGALVESEVRRSQQSAARAVGIKDIGDIENFIMNEGRHNYKHYKGKMMDKYNMSEDQFARARAAMIEMNTETDDFLSASYGRKSTGAHQYIDPEVFENLIDYENPNSENLLAAYYNPRNPDLNEALRSNIGMPGRSSLDAYSNTSSSAALLEAQRSIILHVGKGDASGIDATIIFKNAVDKLVTDGTIKLSDGIDHAERKSISIEVQARFAELLAKNPHLTDSNKDDRMNDLILALSRLTNTIDPENATP